MNYYPEFPFVVWFVNRETAKITPLADVPFGPIRDAVRDNLFAEISVPYHPDNGQEPICYTFHIFNKANDEIALDEALFLRDIVDQVHRDFGDRVPMAEANSG